MPTEDPTPQATTSGANGSGGAPNVSAPVVAPAPLPSRPADLPDAFWKADTGFNTEEAQKFIIERAKAETERASKLPKASSDYKVELPATFKAPEGVQIQLNPTDPMYELGREFAVAKGWTQEDFSDAVGLLAQAEVVKAQKLDAGLRAAREAIPDGPSRIQKVKDFLGAHAGSKAPAYMLDVNTLEEVEAWEAIIGSVSRGGGTFNGNTIAPVQPELSPHEARLRRLYPTNYPIQKAS